MAAGSRATACRYRIGVPASLEGLGAGLAWGRAVRTSLQNRHAVGYESVLIKRLVVTRYVSVLSLQLRWELMLSYRGLSCTDNWIPCR